MKTVQLFFSKHRWRQRFRLCMTAWLFCLAYAPSAMAAITGSGTAASPYTINSAADLATFKGYVESGNTNYIADGKHWKLTTNIAWNNGTDVANRINGYFRGIFDGDGHTISFGNIVNDGDFTGLFAVSSNAVFRNLNIVFGYIVGRHCTGVLLGEVQGNATIENVHVRGDENGSCMTGSRWGGLVGRVWNGGTVNISFCSATIIWDVVLYDKEGFFNAGGLIGEIQSGTVTITDCLTEVNFRTNTSGSQRHSVGGIVGVIDGGTLTINRVFSGSTIPNVGSYERGHVIGRLNTGTTATVYSALNRFGTNYIGNIAGTYKGGTNVTFVTNWSGTAVYDYLERRGGTGLPLGTAERGNEKWGYDSSTRPKLSKTAYAVKVTKGGGISAISNHNSLSSGYYYVNADRQLTVSPSSTPNVHQRVKYTYTPVYSPSAGYSAQMSGNNWLLTAKADGTVSASIENIPYPKTLNQAYEQWDKKVTISGTYDNPQSLTGKFYIYRRQTSSPAGAWTLDNAGLSLSGGTGTFTFSKAYTLAAADFNKTFQYCVAFIEGTGAAPTTPPDGNNKATVEVKTPLSLGEWSVTATGNTGDITVSFTADSRLTNSSDYKYTVQRSVNGGAYTNWLVDQNFNAVTSYTHIDNTPLSVCDGYKYRVVISAFATTFSKESEEVKLTGGTKFASVNPLKATKGEHANYVRLQWNIEQTQSGNEVYRVFRRVANTGDDFTEMETISSDATTVYWSDNNALTSIFYEYKVVLYQVCSGKQTTLAEKTDIGFTQSFGTVSGRVTYGTGSAVQGVNMLVQRNNLQPGENQYRSLKSTGGGQKFEWLADSAYFNKIWTSKQWTLQFWVNPEITNTGTVTIGYIGSYAISMTAVEGGYQIYTDLGTAGKSEIIPANRYSHIALTREGDNLKIHTVCDQDPDSIAFKNTPFTNDAASPQPAAGSKISFGHEMKGNIDEVRFWNRPLSEAEITRDYSRILIGNESGLKGYWTFDYELPGYAFDMSRSGTVYNGNHATTNTLAGDGTVPDGTYQLALKAITNDDGNYQIEGIPFSGEGTSYSIVPSLGVHSFNPTRQLRYISPASMVHNATDFTDISSFAVSGKIVYEGGTYPVEGCSFEIDGRVQTLPNGTPVTTDSEGKFTLSVPIGIHSVKAVKQGHSFVNDGYLKENGADRNYNRPLANLIIEDKTRVKLIGRVVGGLKENDKPLGFGESVNNTGAGTITLSAVKSQYALSTNPVSEEFIHNRGEWKKSGGIANDTTKVTYGADRVTIEISPATGEYMAWVYPEVYTIGEITAPGYGQGGGEMLYNRNEMLDLSNKAVPDDSYMQNSIRTWVDSVWVDRPGELPHNEAVEKSDTIRYHEKWQHYYQAVPTFGVKQLNGAVAVDYFGESQYIVNDALAGTSDTIPLTAVPFTNPATDYTFGLPVFQQGKRYSFEFNAYEEYVNSTYSEPKIYRANVESGTVNLSNTLSLTSYESLATNAEGKARYTFTAGAPDLTTGQHEFFATLQIGNASYYWNLGANPVNAWHLGDKTTGTDFMTSGPNELSAILRDPPGSLSYAYIEKGSTSVTTTKNTVSNGLTEVVGLTTSLGPKVTTFIGIGGGVILESEVKADVSAGLTAEERWTSEEEKTSTTTFTERFETSSDPLYVGGLGDVFIGNSSNIQYGLTNGITIQKGSTGEFAQDVSQTYSIGKSSALAYGQTFDTRFAYTAVELEEIMIPKWQSNLALILKPKGTTVSSDAIQAPVYVSNLEPDEEHFGKSNLDREAFQNVDVTKPYDGDSYTIHFPSSWTVGSEQMKAFQDSVIWYNNQIKGWKNILAQNEKEKVEMKKLGNYSFGSGSNIGWSKTLTSSETYTSDFTFVLNPSIGLVTGADVMGIGLELTTSVEYVHEGSSGNTESRETSLTVGFVLQEEGDDDELTVDYGDANGTIAFKTRGGRTSCPYEPVELSKYYEPGQHILSEGTMQIEVPVIDVEGATSKLNVPANKTADFKLNLKNESETDEDVWFQLIVDEATNPNGAELKIDGIGIGNGRNFLVKAGQVLTKTVTVGKGTANNYSNLGIILRSQCQSDPTTFLPVIADTTYISVEFVPACSEVSIKSPADNWITNTTTGDSIRIELQGYDVNYANFGYVQLEYRSASSPAWTVLQNFYANPDIYNQAKETNKTLLSPTQKTIVYVWKQKDVTDGAYELRATAVCANYHPTTFELVSILSTNTTPAVSGYKDMSKPTVLGALSPATGILGAGDELSVLFNEDIQAGMLTENNFSITGVLNAQKIAEPNVGLSLNGTGKAYTELPVYSSGSFSFGTWFKSATADPAGTLLAYGASGNYLSIGFNAGRQAVATIGSESKTSTDAIANDATWKYLSVSYNRADSTLTAYVLQGTETVTLFNGTKFEAKPETQGKLYVGNKADATSGGFNGAIAHLHAWSKVRTAADAVMDKDKTKAGNEPDLSGYWPLNEGEGLTAKDKARSRNLVLNGVGWYIYPSGKGLPLNGTDQFASINSADFPFDANDDYTLEFWFNGGSQTDATLFSNDNAVLTFNASKELVLNVAGKTEVVTLSTADLLNGAWHHFALSLKGNGTANAYVDGVVCASFASSAIGEFAGGNYYFGTKHRGTENTQFFSGSFDDIRVWNSALTAESIRLNKNSKLRGTEAGLKAYYPFETYVRDANNIVTVTGSLTDEVTKTLSATATGVTISDLAAALQDVRPVEQVSFDYVASNNKIVFNLKEDLSRIEGAVLDIAVADVRDLHNNIGNPLRWTAFVNLNSLKWETPPINRSIAEGASQSFTATIVNRGGTNTDYYLENIPEWLSVDAPQGTLKPLTSKELRFTVFSGINIGTYEAGIVLSGANKVREILPVVVKVTGNRPDWTVNPYDFESTMNITGQITIEGIYQEDTDDILGAFIDEVCVGVASPVYISENNAYFTFMDVYGNSAHSGKNLKFKLWDASTGAIYSKIEFDVPARDVAFVANARLGNVNAPIIHNALDIIEQTIALDEGWNWISVNVANTNPSLLAQFKENIGNAGVLLKGDEGYIQQPGWAGLLTAIEPEKMYIANVNKAHSLKMNGKAVNPATTPITVVPGWNWIGYIPQFTLPVNSALAGMNAQTGDQIKGHAGYRTYMGANGWIGSLDYMRAGIGYMYYSGSTGNQTFNYPGTGSRHYNAPALRSTSNTAEQKWSVNRHRFPNTMTLTSVVLINNVELQSDQIEIGAFVGEDCRGSILLQEVENLDRYLGFLMVFGEASEALSFRIFDHATNTEYDAYPKDIRFTPDAIHGNPAVPFGIWSQYTGLDDVAVKRIAVYPNPVKDLLYINHDLESIDVLQLVDISGRIIVEKTNFVEKSINVSSLAKGVYLLKLTKDGQTDIRKISKK